MIFYLNELQKNVFVNRITRNVADNDFLMVTLISIDLYSRNAPDWYWGERKLGHFYPLAHSYQFAYLYWKWFTWFSGKSLTTFVSGERHESTYSLFNLNWSPKLKKLQKWIIHCQSRIRSFYLCMLAFPTGQRFYFVLCWMNANWIHGMITLKRGRNFELHIKK